MRWNVPNTAVGRIFLVAIALDDDAALPRAGAGERRERQARLEDVAQRFCPSGAPLHLSRSPAAVPTGCLTGVKKCFGFAVLDAPARPVKKTAGQQRAANYGRPR